MKYGTVNLLEPSGPVQAFSVISYLYLTQYLDCTGLREMLWERPLLGNL